MPQPASARMATTGWGSGSSRAFGAGVLIGLLPCVIGLTAGFLKLPFWFSPLIPPLVSFIAGIVMVLRVRTRPLGAGLLLGSGLAAILVPAVALIAWLADPVVVF